MESVFNMQYYFKDYLKILSANIINTYRVQTAYFFENWMSLGSTMFYTLALILFINILYSNITLFAGYSRNEMLFLVFVSQLQFYFNWIWSGNNIVSLIDSVNSGELDMILVKPVPSLFFVTFRDISLINRIKDSVPTLSILILLIDWGSIATSWDLILVGVLVFFLGQLAWHSFSFLFLLPVFYTGRSANIYAITQEFASTNNIPFEGFSKNLRLLFSTLIPTLVTSQITVSIILGRVEPAKMLGLAFVVAVAFLLLKRCAWIISLRNYTSASS